MWSSKSCRPERPGKPGLRPQPAGSVLGYGAGQRASLDRLDVVRRCVEVKHLYLSGETALLNRLDSALTHLSVYSPDNVYFRVGGQHVLHNVERFVTVALCGLGCNDLEAAALILKSPSRR